MPSPVTFLSKHKFRLNRLNTFRIYGENLDEVAVPLKIELASTLVDWTPNSINVQDVDRKKHFVVIRSTPTLKIMAPAPPVPAPAGAAPAPGTDDDLTITLTFDEGAPTEDVIEEDLDNVTYEDPDDPGP